MRITRALRCGLAIGIVTLAATLAPGTRAARAPGDPHPLVAGARQLLLVTSGSWDEVDGTLRRFERSTPSASWRQLGGDLTIVVGANGMAWDAAWPDQKPVPGPIKREGDGRSPAGIFTLTSAFGYATADEAPSKLPYRQALPTTQCVDDAGSRFYNRILDRTEVTPDWSSAEQMRRDDDFYRLGVVVDYNAGPTVPGHGSCIFLHIWNRAGDGTAGCTAMPAGDMTTLMGWLDPAARPVLAQFPREVYEKLRATLPLP
jgi:D-alanyl-D-alanine dipeptidase